jgi:tRNA pseudouridine55 synthase
VSRQPGDDGGSRDGLVIVDKESGWTSHDVVARMRRIAGTRRVGHAGTLDPMATGVLILGINRATRLLGYLASRSKIYEATIRLGASTITDDAEGQVIAQATPADLAAVTESEITKQIALFRGEIRQRPSSVSAIKIDGVRSYTKVRAGEEVVLPAREVNIFRYEAVLRERSEFYIDIDAIVECSSGTYIRALARDLGAHLGVGGHLTALRRTSVDSFTVSAARKIDEYEKDFAFMPLVDAARMAFQTRSLTDQERHILSHGGSLTPNESDVVTAAIFEESLIALVQNRSNEAKPLAVFV